MHFASLLMTIQLKSSDKIISVMNWKSLQRTKSRQAVVVKSEYL